MKKNKFSVLGMLIMVLALGFTFIGCATTDDKPESNTNSISREDYFGAWDYVNNNGNNVVTLSSTESKWESARGSSFTIASPTWESTTASSFDFKKVDRDAKAEDFPAAADVNGYWIHGTITAATGAFFDNGQVGKEGTFAIFFDKNDTNKSYIYVHGNISSMTFSRHIE